MKISEIVCIVQNGIRKRIVLSGLRELQCLNKEEDEDGQVIITDNKATLELFNQMNIREEEIAYVAKIYLSETIMFEKFLRRANARVHWQRVQKNWKLSYWSQLEKLRIQQNCPKYLRMIFLPTIKDRLLDDNISDAKIMKLYSGHSNMKPSVSARTVVDFLNKKTRAKVAEENEKAMLQKKVQILRDEFLFLQSSYSKCYDEKVSYIEQLLGLINSEAHCFNTINKLLEENKELHKLIVEYEIDYVENIKKLGHELNMLPARLTRKLETTVHSLGKMLKKVDAKYPDYCEECGTYSIRDAVYNALREINLSTIREFKWSTSQLPNFIHTFLGNMSEEIRAKVKTINLYNEIVTYREETRYLDVIPTVNISIQPQVLTNVVNKYICPCKLTSAAEDKGNVVEEALYWELMDKHRVWFGFRVNGDLAKLLYLTQTPIHLLNYATESEVPKIHRKSLLLSLCKICAITGSKQAVVCARRFGGEITSKKPEMIFNSTFVHVFGEDVYSLDILPHVAACLTSSIGARSVWQNKEYLSGDRIHSKGKDECDTDYPMFGQDFITSFGE